MSHGIDTKSILVLAWLLLLIDVLHRSAAAAATNLPAYYFELLNAGVVRIERRLATGPNADLQSLEAK